MRPAPGRAGVRRTRRWRTRRRNNPRLPDMEARARPLGSVPRRRESRSRITALCRRARVITRTTRAATSRHPPRATHPFNARSPRRSRLAARSERGPVRLRRKCGSNRIQSLQDVRRPAQSELSNYLDTAFSVTASTPAPSQPRNSPTRWRTSTAPSRSQTRGSPVAPARVASSGHGGSTNVEPERDRLLLAQRRSGRERCGDLRGGCRVA
jgi:hypothetical protein